MGRLRMSGSPERYVLTLRPRLTGPVGLLCFAAFLLALSSTVLGVVSWQHGWWVVLPLWGLTALAARAAINLIKNRGRLFLAIAPEEFNFAGNTIARSDVVAVKKARELHFKGVRVQISPEAWVGISARDHEPGRVIDAFRAQGYPVY
jgi:hypothetical protein